MKHFKPLFVAALLALPFAAAAQEQVFPPAPAATGIGAALAGLLTPGNLGLALGAVLSLIGGFQFFSEKRKRIVAKAAYYAFHMVEDIGAEIDGDDAFDKTATYLKKVDEFMVANGWRPLKPGEVEVAKMSASTLHGVEVAKAKVAEAAAAVVAPSP